jgi:predicted short-subunit dehydrogenase-like oxidoreductase (DUF2520 family)
MQKSIKNIAFAGSGNVAWHMAKGLQMQGYRISKVWSRDFSNAAALAENSSSRACHEISELREGTDLIIIAVADKAIEEVARSIGEFDGIAVHTAGSVSMDVLKGNVENSGVVYPLQTFSKVIPLDFREVPFFLESSSNEVLQALEQIVSKLSSRVYNADSQQRMLLHAAAVFAGNYSNLMYVIGNEILENANLPTDLLHPLIQEIARKAVTGDPLKMQTGPARRNDTNTIEKHISALASMPEYADLYQLLANLISNKYK